MKKEYLLLFLVDSSLLLMAVMIGAVTNWWLTAGVCVAEAALTVLLLWLLHRRSVQVEKMTGQIDRILYGEEHWELEDYTEGELAILADRLGKLVIRLRERDEQLVKEKKLQEQMMTDISHQLRTPLTSMGLLLNALRAPALEELQRNRKLFELGQLLERVEELISLLLKLAKLDSGTALVKRESVSCQEVVHRALQPLEIAMELHDISLHTEIAEDCSFLGDRDWMSEALTNIVKNSLEHMEDGGTISIQAEENALFTRFVLTDTGCGISEEELPHIFERFYRGSGARHTGYGIGMSFVRMAILAQNGTIRAENRAPHGMQFTIQIYREQLPI